MSSHRVGAMQAYRAEQRTFNLCRLCDKTGHWIRECKEPHTACYGPYCQVCRDHPGFYRQACLFPKRQVGKRGTGKCKHEADTTAEEGPAGGEKMAVDAHNK
jgi:hypothetical protein